MAASSGREMHIGWFIGALILALTFGVLFYMQGIDDRAKLQVAASAAKDEANRNQGAVTNKIKELDAVKSLIGLDVENVGLDDPDNNSALLGMMKADINKYGGNLAKPTLRGTIIALRDDLESTKKELAQANADKAEFERRLLALENEYRTKSDAFQEDTKQARSDLQTRIGSYEELLKTRDQELTDIKRKYTDLQLELEQEREAAQIALEEKDQRISQIEFINDKLNDRIDEITKVSFEKPDGVIRNVDNATRLVAINLGSEDRLRPQLTFSVYEKNNSGVARGPEDRKGAIEVTEIKGPHLAMARILEGDIFRPFAPGDVIYSPIWQPGRSEKFSFVGLIDLDGDGINDREILHDLISSAGAEIDNEVGDDGEWVLDENGNPKNDGISVSTTFLVVGDIPDPSQTNRQEERDTIDKMNEKYNELRSDARINSVRVVKLNDFLSWIGWTPKRRLYVPGLSDKPYTLKAGSQSESNAKSFNDRTSTGKVSELFYERRTGQKTSSGQTSGSTKSSY